MNNDTYCPMPFVTLAVNPNNWLTRCMMSNYNMGPIENDSWSNDKFTALRTDMLAGKWDEQGCHSCWFKEKNGQKSRRNRWIDSELKYMGETNIYKNNLSVKRNTIKHLYMNFNNICNFKCRMCGPHYSNAWLPDWKKMQAWEMDQSSDKSYTKSLHDAGNKHLQVKQQIDVDKFLNEFGPELGELHGIWVTGGEPFMDDSVFDFFNKLKQYCDPQKLKVLITTNASKLDVHKLEQLSGFKRLLLHVSIDATGDLYKYMRGYNYTWEEIDAKIKLMHSCQEKYNYRLSINGTYQIHNMLNLEEFYNWALQFDTIVNGKPQPAIDWIEMRVLSGPKWLQARHATDGIKLQALAQLNRLRERFPNHQYFDDILKEINAVSESKYQKEFVTWNKKLDEIRGETYDYNW